jgi:hypothetical protein
MGERVGSFGGFDFYWIYGFDWSDVRSPEIEWNVL